MIAARIAAVLPWALGTVPLLVALAAPSTTTVIVTQEVDHVDVPGAPAGSLGERDANERRVPTAMELDGPRAIDTARPVAPWCSTAIPPIDHLAVAWHGTQVFEAAGVLVLRVPVAEGEKRGDVILREMPGGYCMLVGMDGPLEVATVGSWVVYAQRDTLWRTRVDDGRTERVAALHRFPVGIRAHEQRAVIVDYEYARVGSLAGFGDSVPSDVFEIVESVQGVDVPGLARVDRPDDDERVRTSDDIAWLRRLDGEEMIVRASGRRLCTLVPAGSPVVYGEFSGWLYYVRDAKVWRMARNGGPARFVARVSEQPVRIGIREGEMIGLDKDWKQTWTLSVGDTSPKRSDPRFSMLCGR